MWEVFEFAVDQLFSTNMQRSGLVDTMWDLIVDCLGAFKKKRNASCLEGLETILDEPVEANCGVYHPC